MSARSLLVRSFPALLLALALVALAGLSQHARAEADPEAPVPVVVDEGAAEVDVEAASSIDAEEAVAAPVDDAATAHFGDPEACAQLAVDTYNMCRKFSNMLECAILAVSVEGWCLML